MSCVSLLKELTALNIPEPARPRLLGLYLDRANLASYEKRSYSIVEFVAEVKKEMAEGA